MDRGNVAWEPDQFGVASQPIAALFGGTDITAVMILTQGSDCNFCAQIGPSHLQPPGLAARNVADTEGWTSARTPLRRAAEWNL